MPVLEKTQVLVLLKNLVLSNRTWKNQASRLPNSLQGLMDSENIQTSENPISSTERCKLILFLIIILCIIAYLGLCARILVTAQYTYPPSYSCKE